MNILKHIFELLVGLLAVLAIGASVWFAGVYILLGLLGIFAIFLIWAFGQSIVELDKRVITDQVVAEEARRDALVDPYCVGETDPAVHGMVEKSEYSIQTAVPPVHVSDRNVLQWLRAMNVPIGAPITIQFIDDLTSKGTAVTERL